MRFAPILEVTKANIWHPLEVLETITVICFMKERTQSGVAQTIISNEAVSVSGQKYRSITA